MAGLVNLTNPSDLCDLFVKNPDILLKKDEKQKVLLNALNSGKSQEEITPKKLKKVIDVLGIQGRIIGYSSFAGYLCTSIAKEITSSSALFMAHEVFNTITRVSFGALYTLSVIQNSYQLVKNQNFIDLLKQEDVVVLKGLIQNLFNPISIHLDQLKISWDKLDPKQQEFKKQQFKQKIQKMALNELKTKTLSLELQEKDLEEFLKSLQTSEHSEEVDQLLGLTDQDYWKFNPLEAIGLIIDCQKIKARNWTKLREASSTKIVGEIDKAYKRGLLERIHCTDPSVKKVAKKQMKKLVGRVRVESCHTKRIHISLLVINLVGIILSIAGALTIPFGVGIALLALSCLVTISSLGFKMYLFRKELANTPCGKYDKALVITIAIVLGVSLIAFTGVTLGFGLSLVQLGMALGPGFLLPSGFLGYYYYLLNQKDKLWKEAHPSLEVFQKFILDKRNNKRGWDKEVHDLFKKLPKDLRLAIRQRYEKRNLPNQLTERNQISAFKKTSKYFWNQWLITGSEESCKLALEIQSVYDFLRLEKKLPEENKLNDILQNQWVREQLEKDRKYVFYRKSSLRDLYEVTQEVSQKLLKCPLT